MCLDCVSLQMLWCDELMDVEGDPLNDEEEEVPLHYIVHW